MTNDGRWRPEGNAFEQPGDDSTRHMPAADQAGPGAHGAGGATAYGSGPAPTYPPSSGDGGPGYAGAPAYGGAGGYGGPGDDGGSGGDLPPGGGRRGSGFPWIGVVVAVLAIAAAAAANWYFLLRDTGGEDEGGDESASDDSSQTADESSSAPAPPPQDPDEPTSEDAEEETTPDDDSEAPPDGTDEPTDTEEDTDDDASESPSDDDQGDGGNGGDGDGGGGDVVQLEVGETHTLSNGAEITLDEVERDYECPIPSEDPLVALTFTVVGGDTPTDTPRPGISLETSEGDTGLLDGAGCLGDEALTPMVEGGEEATGLVLVAAPTEDAFDVEFTPVLSGFTGTPETLSWTID